MTTSRNRILATMMVALLLVPAVAIFAPAATAQDNVPTRPTVPWEPIPNLRQFLFARFSNLGAAQSAQPDCADPAARRLQISPATVPSQVGGRSACTFAIAVTSDPVVFETPSTVSPRRTINFTGNNSFLYHHRGTIPDGVTLSITLQTDTQTIATGTIAGDGSDEYSARLNLAGPTANTGRVVMLFDRPVRLTLQGSAPPAQGAVPVPTSWSLDDTDSYLELRGDDAVRSAVWITNERDEIRSVFAPIANESQRVEDKDRRVVGHFALQSAFGIADARGIGDDADTRYAPRFSIHINGTAKELGAGGITELLGQYNSSASVPDLGVAVWSFPKDSVNYRSWAGGQYTLQVRKNHWQGDPIDKATRMPFAITSQSVELRGFVDPRNPAITESLSHSVMAGGSTTYILAVNNTGFVHDNFTINLSTANAPPGWGAAVGGPDVLARTIFVPAGETRVFTVTVTAPFAATGQVIHIVNVTSMLDPGARSRDLTLFTSVSNEIIREVGIIFLPRDLTIEPGVETHFPVYVWNRGTRPANVSLEIKESPIAGWIVDLALGNTNVDRLVLSSIPSGDIARATLKVTGPLAATVPSYPITLNATSQDAAGISAERTLTFALNVVAGVTLKVLSEAGTRAHVAELSGPRFVAGPDGQPVVGAGGEPVANPACDPRDGPDCTDDGVQGLWYRVWITNSGKLTDAFDLTGHGFTSSCPRNEAQAFPDPAEGMRGDFGFFFRSPSGIRSQTSRIEIPASKTAELYVFVPVNKDSEPCGDASEKFSFVIQARGAVSQAIAVAGIEAEARNDLGGGSRGVYVEGVVRESGYSNAQPFVDIQNATKRTIAGEIEPGKNLTYYVRLTNTASWSEYVTGSGNNQRRVAPDLRVSLSGVNREAGWNVSIRPVLDASQMDLERNPYSDTYNLSNVAPSTPLRREAWFDRELEVVVQAPSIENGTALAGLTDEFQIEVFTNATGDKSTLEIVTVVKDLANVTVRSEKPVVFAHPGKPGALLLYVTNNGSSEAKVTLRASMTQDTPNAGAWQFSQNEQTFPLAAFKNRTVALLITPPAGSTQGVRGDVNVTLTYASDPDLPNATTNVTRRPTIEVVQPGTLQLTPPVLTSATIAPSGTANFTMTLRNTGSLAVPFRAVATPIPNWSVSISPEQGTLGAGDSRTLVLVLTAPGDVVSNSTFASIARVEERNPDGTGNAANFDTSAFNVNILGGKALPKLTATHLVKRVPRAGIQSFEVAVQNVGSIAGRFPLEVRSQDPAWIVAVQDQRGNPISAVELQPNQLQNVNVTVRAPFNVPERTVTPVELTAFSPDGTQQVKAPLSAEIHDHGVSLQLVPPNKDALPGIPVEFVARVRNTGNDNDTLNLSVNLVDLPEWSVALSSEEVRLEPNQETEIRATIRSPTGPLPSPRTYTFPFWVGTRGGQAVNITKNMTASAVVTVPNYRSYDVDRDGNLEIAVDLDKRSGNGFEEFREIFTDGVTTQVVAKGLFEGRTTFFLDTPRNNPYDGVADVWFNPESVYGYEIKHAPDINGDGTPDYLLDADRDGRIETAFDSSTERFWEALEVKVYGDERIQYLVDMTGDGKPDRFYEPERQKVTRTQAAKDVGADVVGIDVDDDDRVDYYYNTRTKETSQAAVGNVGSFARDYWYFFVVFAVLVLLSVVLIVRRRRAP